MNLEIGNTVSRISHGHDIIFKIVGFQNDLVLLQGVNVRLSADSKIDDLVKVDDVENDDSDIIERNLKDIDMDRSNYFYIPGRVLHIDGDNDYLDRCMKFYKHMGIQANGISMREDLFYLEIVKLIQEYRPDIVVITGHDAYYKNKSNHDEDKYQNSNNFIKAIKNARKYEKNQDKLIIIAGACQSNYEELIKAGANFASSPKRINIHALDPAIIASSLAFSDRNQSIDLLGLISKTKYGSDGIGGIITNGTMYVGYPR